MVWKLEKGGKNMRVSFVLFPFWGVMNLEVDGEEGAGSLSNSPLSFLALFLFRKVPKP